MLQNELLGFWCVADFYLSFEPHRTGGWPLKLPVLWPFQFFLLGTTWYEVALLDTPCLLFDSMAAFQSGDDDFLRRVEKRRMDCALAS